MKKLIELLDEVLVRFRFDAWENSDKIAEHLVENGVTVFPLNVGDDVYCVQKNAIRVATVLRVCINPSGVVSYQSETDDHEKLGFCSEDLGHTVFLSIEEAAEKLKEKLGEHEKEKLSITKANIEAVAEQLAWNVYWGTQLNSHGETEAYAEFSQFSPAGEDFIFTVFYDELEDLPEEVESFAEDFAPEEHAAMWFNSDANGVPGLKVLVEDAFEIAAMLSELRNALCELE